MQPVLTEQAELLCSELCGCLARVGSLLARAEDALGKIQVGPAVSPMTDLQFGFAVGRKQTCMFPSPLVLDLAHHRCMLVVAPVLQTMPELHELGGEPSSHLSMVFTKVISTEASTEELPVVPKASGIEAVVEVITPVLQIMPEPLMICGEPTSPILWCFLRRWGRLEGPWRCRL